MKMNKKLNENFNTDFNTDFNIEPILRKDHKETSAPMQYGWVCPKCGAVYGPSVRQCFCSNNHITC